jgi:hypothetical protein
LTPGIGGLVNIFPSRKVCEWLMCLLLCLLTLFSVFDNKDRTVASTPTLVVPHWIDGFAEAIQ